MAEDDTDTVTDDSKSNSPKKLEELTAEKERLEEVLNLLEEQLYDFEGELLSNAFYGSVLHGWSRSALSIVPSRAQPSALKRSFDDDERLCSKSSVEFMKRQRCEEEDQETRSPASSGRVQKQNYISANGEVYEEGCRRAKNPVNVGKVEAETGVLNLLEKRSKAK